MSKIKCNASNCGYNENLSCQKRKVMVEGNFAKSKIGTFCESFLNPNRNSKVYTEMAKDMFDETNSQKINKINCSANYCKYNDAGLCVASEIHVGNPSAKYRSETECSSFELK